MFAPGELIYCGRRGVCRVENIEEIEGRPYYHLEPLYYTCTIHTPVDGKVFMRPVMTKAEAEALVDLIPNVEAPPVQSKAIRELVGRYQAKINTHEAAELLAMLMSIHAKKRQLSAEKKKLGAIDERFMKEGEALLFGELAAALNIQPQEVPQFIQKRLGERRCET